MLKVSLIKSSFDNLKFVSNPQNDDFNDFPFDGDERLIVSQGLYGINIKSLIVYVKTNLTKE